VKLEKKKHKKKMKKKKFLEVDFYGIINLKIIIMIMIILNMKKLIKLLIDLNQ
jgi:hypothetical protein